MQENRPRHFVFYFLFLNLLKTIHLFRFFYLRVHSVSFLCLNSVCKEGGGGVGRKKKKEKQLWNTYGCVSERPLASSEGVGGGSGVSGLGGGGEAGEGAGLVQCTKPFQGHLCCYTFKNEYRKRKKKKQTSGTWRKNSQFLFS